jgi:signal transduction histidine kinase/CheY-like chemotaxis protein
MNQHSNLSVPEPSAPHGPAPDSAPLDREEQLEIQLWLERHCNQISQQINSQLLSCLSRDRPLHPEQQSMMAAELFQVVVNELRAALGNGVVAIALPWHDPDLRFQAASSSSGSETVFQVCHVAPPKSRRRPSADTPLLQGLRARLSPGETLLVQDLQQRQSDWQTAWQIKTSRGLVGWLIVAPTELPDQAPMRQAWLDLIERVVQPCAIAISQIQLLQVECPQCRKLETRIRELEKINQLKSEFLANTSHEIRTPLNSMLGFVQLLHQSQSSELAAHQDYLNIILSSGQYLLALVNDILDLSKVEADRLDLQWETIHVPDLCHSLIILIAEKAHAKGLQLRINFDPNVTTFVADPLRLKQMLFNLLSNAVKFTSSGTVGLSVNLVGVFLHFTVWDTGAGMTKEQQVRLFRPYTQFPNEVVKAHEGTGLGLVVSQKLARLHGGRIEVHSELNQGSQFTLVLPLTPAVGDRQAPPEIPVPKPCSSPTAIPSSRAALSSPDLTYRPTAPTAPNSTVPPSALGKPILVVEDNASNARLVLTYLAKLGYQVLWAKNSEELWICLKNTLPALILMDIGLPDVDGITLIKQLRANLKYKSIPIVVQTAMTMMGDRETCLEAGAVAYLPKPVALDVLARLVADYSSSKMEK